MRARALKLPDLRPKVCILVPVCNEEESLNGLKAKLEELHRSLESRYELEYCIVDDGSTDATPFLIGSAAPDRAKCTVLSHLQNLGVGAAFRTGFAHVHADIVCTIDADCSYAPAEMSGLLEVIARGEADVVVASPYHPNGAVQGVQRWRLLLSLNCSLLYRAATPLKLHTYTSIFRAYKGSVARKVIFPSNGFVSAVEILLSAASQGFRVAEVPSTLTRRVAGCSKMRLLRTVRTHLQLLSRCCVAKMRGGYPRFTPPAIAPTAASGVRVTLANSGTAPRASVFASPGRLPRADVAHTDAASLGRIAQA